jgi:WYL domain-containing protein
MKKNVLSFPPSRDYTLDSQLRFAIANKRLIRFTYESVVRIAEPHDYGVRDGAARLLAFQRQKAGRKHHHVRGWRLLDISRIEDCIVLEESFRGTRANAGQQHYHWDVLYARVE